MIGLALAQVDVPMDAARSASQRLLELLTFQAGYNATIVLLGTVLLGVACAVIGSFLLLRRRSLVADALSHAALPGVCFGFLLGVWIGFDDRNLLLLLGGAALFGLLGVICVHLISTLPRVHEDAAIGVVLSVFFALGIVLLKSIEELPTGNQAGLNRFIFGSAASMIGFDLSVIIVLALIALIVPMFIFKELRLVCFDPGFAQAIGWPTLLLDGILLALVTLATVAGIHAVGAILMVALLIIPPAAARFWTDRLWVMLIIAAAIGGAGAWLGTAASVSMERMPTGPAIVVACGGLFVVSLIVAPRRGLLLRWIERIRIGRNVGRAHVLRALYECMETRGDFEIPVSLHALAHRRRWKIKRLRRLLRRAVGRGDVVRVTDAHGRTTGFRFSDDGFQTAKRIVRTHRLWEHYLTTHADVAPSHVDRAADTIEHVLGEALVSRIENSLLQSGRLAQAGAVPASPHTLNGPTNNNPAEAPEQVEH